MEEIQKLLEEEKIFNEYIMTSLRTIWGTDLEYVKQHFGEVNYLNILSKSNHYIHSGDIINKDNKLILTGKGKLISDHIIQDLFI